MSLRQPRLKDFSNVCLAEQAKILPRKMFGCHRPKIIYTVF